MNPAKRVDGIIPPGQRAQILESMEARETTCDGEGGIYGKCWRVESEGEIWLLDQWAYASYRAHCTTCETREPRSSPPVKTETRDPSACVLGALVLLAIVALVKRMT